MSNENKLRHDAVVMAIQKKADPRSVSRELPEDYFEGWYASGDVIEPPFDPYTLATINEASSMIGPCVEAMVVNITSVGHRIVPRDDIWKAADKIPANIEKEITEGTNFFANAVLDGTFSGSRAGVRADIEYTGNGYYQVIPSMSDPSKPAGLTHLPSWTMRLTKQDKEMTPYEVSRPMKVSDGKWKMESFSTKKRFRRFVQRSSASCDMVYFKEFGDPRVIDYTSGKVLAQSWKEATPEQRDKAANSVIHIKLYCARSPYGIPRYIGNLFTIFGNRAAELVNYVTLKCNNIPALVLLATNVQVTDGSLDRIKEFVEERIQGDNNYSSLLIIEGEPASESFKDPGTMKMDLKPMTREQHTDAMFVQYMERGDKKVRMSFRLPPIFVGLSEEYTRSIADASRRVAEDQIFLPERNTEDDLFNNTIVCSLGLAHVMFKTNAPNVTDNYELTQLLATAERSGGLTPRISRLVVEDVLGRDLPDVDPSIDPDIPFTFTTLKTQLAAAYSGGNQYSLDSSETSSKLLALKNALVEKGIGPELIGIIDDVIDTTDHPIIIQTNKSAVSSRDILKIESDEMIIGGAVLVPNVTDLQGETYDAETVREAAYYWFEHYLEDPSKNGIKMMHDKNGTPILNQVRPIQSYVLDEERTFKLELTAADKDHPAASIKSVTYPAGTWMLYARIRDADLWKSLKNGDFLGWSIGGVATVIDIIKRRKALSNR